VDFDKNFSSDLKNVEGKNGLEDRQVIELQ